MTSREIEGIAKGFAPVVRTYVERELEPIRRRLEALEAERRKQLPVYRVKAGSRAA